MRGGIIECLSMLQESVAGLNDSIQLLSTKSRLTQLKLVGFSFPTTDLWDVSEIRMPKPSHDELMLDVSFAKAAVLFLSPGLESVARAEQRRMV
jgi:hypothetical protein